jgi:hypothetical protein
VAAFPLLNAFGRDCGGLGALVGREMWDLEDREVGICDGTGDEEVERRGDLGGSASELRGLGCQPNNSLK